MGSHRNSQACLNKPTGNNSIWCQMSTLPLEVDSVYENLGTCSMPKEEGAQLPHSVPAQTNHMGRAHRRTGTEQDSTQEGSCSNKRGERGKLWKGEAMKTTRLTASCGNRVMGTAVILFKCFFIWINIWTISNLWLLMWVSSVDFCPLPMSVLWRARLGRGWADDRAS